jgi:hypothetical protein
LNSFPNVPVVADCRSIVCNVDGRVDIEDILDLATFMNRIGAIKNFFELCVRSVACFKSDLSVIGQTVPTGENLAGPGGSVNKRFSSSRQ